MTLKANTAIWLLFFATTLGFGQNKDVVDSLKVKNTITDYSIDVSGNIYLAFEGGSITKYGPDLDSLFTYSPIQVGNVRLLEAGSGLRIFAFYDSYQEYLVTDRFLTQPILTKLNASALEFVEIANQSQDNKIWLVENSGLRLVKYDPATKTILIETFLSPIVEAEEPSFTFVREYQNQVFLVDSHSGIYVFDNLGNYLRKIDARTKKCTFFGNEILFMEEGQLIISDLYGTDKTTQKISDSKALGVLLYKNNLYTIEPKGVYQYQWLGHT